MRETIKPIEDMTDEEIAGLDEPRKDGEEHPSHVEDMVEETEDDNGN